MIEKYRLNIRNSADNPNSHELFTSANHSRNQLLVVFRYETGKGVAERLKIGTTGYLAVKIGTFKVKDSKKSSYTFEGISPQLGSSCAIHGEYSVHSGTGILQVSVRV